MVEGLEHPLKLIEWVDASRLSAGWMDLSDIPEPYPHRCVSVGFVISSNDHGIVIVPTVADLAHEENRHAFGGMLIPRTAVLSERDLSAPSLAT